MSGPYETEREASAAVQHILSSPPGTGAWGDGCHRLLEEACRAARVQLGAYDHQILLWLAGWEPATCAVIAGLITRAAQHRTGEALRLENSGPPDSRQAAILSRFNAAQARTARERAEQLLVWYIRGAWEAAGKRWDGDNETEVQSIVDAILDAARAEAVQ